MSPAFWLTIGGIAVLLFMSAFFSGSETALTAVSRARVHSRAKEGSKRAQSVEKLIDNRERLIGALLLGNNLVNILASSLATSVLIMLFGDTGVVYATIVMTLAVVVFAEVLPKTWAINQPDEFAFGVAPIVRPIVAVLAPITISVQAIVRMFLRLLGVNADDDRSGYTGVEEIRGTVDLLHREGEVFKDDRDRLGGILDLKDLDVSDIMIHRTRMLALNADQTTEQLVQEILESPYTRMPLYKNDTDNIIGVVHAKDVLRALIKAGGDLKKIRLNRIASKPWFIPETTPLEAQLNAFLKGNAHFALVIDEYGEVQGLITLEDILEEIVGDISDEHDEVMQGITKQADGSYLLEGGLPIRDINRALDWHLPDEEATTIAGLVIHEAKMIPAVGQQFTFLGFRFRVTKTEGNRVIELRITPLRAENAAAAAKK